MANPPAKHLHNYDVWKAPLDSELYDSTPDTNVTTTSHQEVNLSKGYKFRGRKLQATDERTPSEWQGVVKSLNTQPGLIMSKKDDQIVTLKKKYREKSHPAWTDTEQEGRPDCHLEEEIQKKGQRN